MEWNELGNINLLITDDDEFNRQLIITLISKIPTIQCFEASNGIEALSILEENSIDILLLDLHMPKMDGYETLDKIKDIPNYEAVEIIIITTDEEEKKKLLKMGANDFLPKPFDLKELENRIYEHIKSRKDQEKSINKEKDTDKDIKKEKNTHKKEVKKEKASTLTSQKELFTLAEIEDSQRESLLRMATMFYQKENVLDRVKRIALLTKAFSIMVGHKSEVSENLYHSTFMMYIGKYFINSEEKNSQKEYKDSILAGYKLLNTFVETKFIRLSKIVMVQHREHFDGTGYPQKSKEQEIHTLAYIVSIVEAFELLSSKEEYEGTLCENSDEVYKFLELNNAGYFHPKVTKIFLNNFNYFNDLRDKSIKKKTTRSI